MTLQGNHGVTLKIQWHFLNGICIVTQSQAMLWEREFEEVLQGLGWEKYRIGNVDLFIETNGYLLIGLRECHQNGWKEAEYGSHEEEIARSVTKWTRTWDRRLARFIFYIHHTSDYRQYFHVVRPLSKVDGVCSETHIALGTSRNLNKLW